MKELVIDRVVSPIFEGRSFGAAGQYEMVYCRGKGELDPADPLNAEIVNLDKGPRNANGNVEYAMDVSILKPIDITKGNGRLFYDVLNRGDTKALGPLLNRGADTNTPRAAADAGDGFLFEHGHILVWSAWQGDIRPGNGRPLTDFPVATEGDRPFVGMCRNEFIYEADYVNTGRILLSETDSQDMSFAESQKIFFANSPKFIWVLGYPAADLDPAKGALTIRHTQESPRETPPDLTWRYVNEDMIEINRPAGFKDGALYEFIFPAKQPKIMAIGHASVRDLVSFLRFETSDAHGRPNPLVTDGVNPIRKTISVGFSQGARASRDFLYGGFNQDEAHRRVFDGVFVVIGGARKGNINVPFAYPNLSSREHESHLIPDDCFPFSYTTVTDPISGQTDGLLRKYEGTDAMPKVFHLDTDTEFWQARCSLMVYDGEKAIPPLDNVRLYMASSMQHSPAYSPMPGFCKYPPNQLDYVPFVRALFVALEEWVVDDREPPASRFPSVVNGTLVSPSNDSYGFPRIEGVHFTGRVNYYRMVDHTKSPPEEGGRHYPILVSKIDADGNAIPGIRHPLLEAPLGTHVGWNLRTANRGEDHLAGMEGSFFPFAKTAAERKATNDDRLSLEERYPTHESYVAIVAEAARRLVRERLLLDEDAEKLVKSARASDVGR